MKQKRKIKIDKIQNILFYSGVLFLGLEYWLSKVSVEYNTNILYIIAIISLVFSLNPKKYTIRDISIGIILVIISAISYYIVDSFTLAKISIVLIGLKGRNIDTTLRIMMISAIISAVLTIIPNIVFGEGIMFIDKNFGRGEIERRYCFGFSQPNNLHLIYIYISTCLLYFKFDHLKARDIIVVSILNILLFILTKSRTGLIIGFIMAFLYLIFKYTKICDKNVMRKSIQIACIIIVIVSILVTILYGNSSILENINKVLTGRLEYANRHFNQYGITLFGKNMQIIGALDFGIIAVLLKYGIVPYIVIVGGMIVLIGKYLQEKKFNRVVMLLTFLIYAITEDVLYYMFINSSLIFLVDLLFNKNDEKRKNVDKRIVSSEKEAIQENTYK